MKPTGEFRNLQLLSQHNSRKVSLQADSNSFPRYAENVHTSPDQIKKPEPHSPGNWEKQNNVSIDDLYTSTETKSFNILEKKKPDLGGSGLSAMNGDNVPTIIAYPELNANGHLVCAEQAMGNSIGGFVKIPRSLLTHPAWNRARRKHKYIFLEMIFRAAWAPTSFYWNGKKVNLSIGQLYFSRRKLAEELSNPKEPDDKITDADIRGALRYFFKCDFLTQPLTQPLTHGPMVVTIVYSTFCKEEMIFSNPAPNPAPNPDLTQTSPTKEEDKEHKEKKKRKSAPELFDFGKFVKLEKAQHEELTAQFGKLALDAMIEKINDHCESTGKKYVGYAATIRNWFRREQTPISKAVPDKSKSKTLGDILSLASLGDYTYQSEFGNFKLISPQGYAVFTRPVTDVDGIFEELKKKRLIKN